MNQPLTLTQQIVLNCVVYYSLMPCMIVDAIVTILFSFLFPSQDENKIELKTQAYIVRMNGNNGEGREERLGVGARLDKTLKINVPAGCCRRQGLEA